MEEEAANRRIKRTRTQTRVNEEQLHSSVNEEEREESSEDFEDSRARAKRSKPLGGTSSAAARNAHQSLIDVVKGDRRQIPVVVKHWVEHYEKDPKAAMAGLLSMMFEACGAKYHIEEDFFDQTDVDDVVVALVNMAKRGEVEDYQTSKKKDFKNFKDNLVYFWDTLVAECENGPLFDKVLFDKCMDYVIALSCTPPRVYRQVASLMGLQLVTSFIHVTKVLGSQRETTQRQLNVEKKKKVDGPRVESLNKRLSMTHEKITIIEEMMRKIFTGLFMHRYRDVEPDIRMACIQSLGVWILSYPSLFLQDLYLKYLGWTLNDKSDGVRKASVLALQNLYEVDDNVPSLGLFTERFYRRMIELADDVDISVAVCAIGLVKQLIRHQLVPEEELSSLYDLLIDDPPEIRRAIGALVYDNLIAQRLNSSQSSSGDNADSSEVYLNRLLRILGEFSKDEMLSMYVIDDIWEYMDAMKDWKRILSMLLEEGQSAELSDVDATNLIRLLFASIRKAVGEKIVPASDNKKQYYTKAQKDMFESSKRDITVAMMKNYPQLLRKFMSDKAKIPYLLEIIVHMNLELYSLKRQDQNFKSAVLLMKEAFFKHGEKEALRSCVKALNFCVTESRGELQDFALHKLKGIEDELIVKLKSAIKEVADGDDEYSLLVNLKRLYELQLSRQISIESLHKDLAQTLKNFRSIDDEVIGFLLLNMHLHVCWCLHSIINSGAVLEQSISSLISKRSALFELLESFLTTKSPEGLCASQLACRICVIFSEQWCLFRKATFASTELEALGYSPDESILQKFWKLCECQLHIPVFKKAIKIHSYISQRPLLLNLMRKFTNERNLVKPAKTRFATAYLTMRAMYNQKKNLRMLILSTEWTSSRFAKETLGKDVANLLISAHFWNDVVRALKVCGPLTTVLRLVDGERKPPMGYIYEAMDRAKEAIAQAFGGVVKQYEKVFEIIDARWTDQLHRPLHAAGFILNPGLFYKAHNDGTIHQNVWPGCHACVEKMNPDIATLDLLVAELPRYKNAEGLFGCGQAQRAKDTRSPDETEEEDSNREYIEETNRDAVIIAVGKLVAVDAVPKEYLAPEILSHLSMHGTSVSEVIKHLLTVLRNNGTDVARLFLEALKRAHQRYLIALFSDDDVSARKTFHECEDLASGLAKTIGKAARNKHRSDLLNIVTGGIQYAFTDAPKHLSFLDGAVLHFISKLPPPDIMDILKDVEKRTENVNTDEDPSGWRPYHIFVEMVREKYVKGEGLQDDKIDTVVRRRGRPPKKQNLQGKKLFDEHNSSEDEESISGSDQEADEEKQDDEEVPLIHSFKSSSKLRSLKISRES